MKIQETVRKDGLRIISCKLPHKKKVFVDLVARVGSAYDPTDKPGLFHCFEHMAFKGTKRHNISDLQSFVRKDLLYSNAWTGKLFTVYEASTIDRKLPQICDYLCDIYSNSTFPEKELRKERHTIHLEIARREDNDSVVARHFLDANLYRENPLRRWSSTIEGINRVRRDDLLKQKATWYVPSNTIAIAIGSVDHDDFVKEISKRISVNYRNVQRKFWHDEANEPPAKRDIFVKRPKRNKAIVVFGRKIPSDIDLKTEVSLATFSKLMGLDNTSRLYTEIREKRGLAYAINAAYSSTPGLGDGFYVYTEVHPSKTDSVSKLIWRTLVKPFSDKKEFEEFRESMFDSFEVGAFEQTSTGTYEDRILRKIVEEKPVKDVETEDKRRKEVVKSLSIKDINKVQREFMQQDKFARVVLRPR